MNRLFFQPHQAGMSKVRFFLVSLLSLVHTKFSNYRLPTCITFQKVLQFDGQTRTVQYFFSAHLITNFSKVFNLPQFLFSVPDPTFYFWPLGLRPIICYFVTCYRYLLLVPLYKWFGSRLATLNPSCSWFFGLKYLYFLMRTGDGKNSDPGLTSRILNTD